MRRALSILAVALLASTGFGAASLIERVTGIRYQDDAGSGRDADDQCTAFPHVGFPAGAQVQAELLWPDDNDDYFALFAPPGSHVRLEMDATGNTIPAGNEGLPVPVQPLPIPWDFDLQVLAPDCATTLGEGSNAGNQPETVEFRVPDGVGHVVVRTYVPRLLGLVPFPFSAPPGLQLRDASAAAVPPGLAASTGPTTDSSEETDGATPPCYPGCYVLRSTFV